MEIQIECESQLIKTAKTIIEFATQNKVFLFYGEMGAGKTTLINAICKHLGVVEHTSSPTFSIVNQYQTKQDEIFHFDFYRLKNQTEALDLGYEEYFYSGAYCFVEWPEKIPDLLPPNCVKVKITVLEEKKRMIFLT
ncbi:MAG: tRNA (adenosine(37)-N6)-threonylcarbamoyltransferase complex ATPase subunit type 1 TsaE [Sphingobacteriales bacterium]|nr:MAG: tRNA (adenosine(37)-N6)-threonylcarbamoyltransferase complex ATPase subunit type 1 TsaE [Sphingobacteriales bacterium]